MMAADVRKNHGTPGGTSPRLSLDVATCPRRCRQEEEVEVVGFGELVSRRPRPVRYCVAKRKCHIQSLSVVDDIRG